jgi:hypothetical protein
MTWVTCPNCGELEKDQIEEIIWEDLRGGKIDHLSSSKCEERSA